MVKMVTAKSSMQSVKARMNPLIRPGNIAGRITLRRAWNGVDVYKRQPYKYLTNFLQMPVVLLVFLVGVVASTACG